MEMKCKFLKMGCTRADSFVYLPGNDLIREMKYHTEKKIYILVINPLFLSLKKQKVQSNYFVLHLNRIKTVTLSFLSVKCDV